MNENTIASVTALQALQRNNPSPFQPYAHELQSGIDSGGDGPRTRVWRKATGFRLRLIVGPPGTGKTRRLIELVGGEVRAGVEPKRIAYVAFSRAALAAALTRARTVQALWDDEVPWFRTIHSTARRLLNHPPTKLVTEQPWREFAKSHQYDFSDVEIDEGDAAHQKLPCRTSDDLLRFAYDWGRNCRLSTEQTLARFPTAGLNGGVFRTYVQRFEEFKAENGLRDFVDLLEDALVSGMRPPVEVAFIDEAQDLSPLQIALVETWFRDCRQVYVAGDDDQAIYVHNGAHPDWIRELAACCPVEHLTTSQRLPTAVLAYASQIIGRNNKRVPKQVVPRAPGGEVRSLDREAAVELLDGSQSTFVLARNRVFLAPIARALIERLVPFVVDGKGAPSPLSEPKLVQAVTLSHALCTRLDTYVSARGLVELLGFLPQGSALLPSDTIEKLRSYQRSQRCFTREQMADELGLGALLARIDIDGPLAPFEKLVRWKRDYLAGLLGRFGTLPEPQITLTSIHASKGKEADLVVVLADMAKKTFVEYRSGGERGFEAENRAFYVAVTRARKSLVVVDARSRRHYDFPTPLESSPTAVRERWEERAAIVEYDAGVDRTEAERRAVRGGDRS